MNSVKLFGAVVAIAAISACGSEPGITGSETKNVKLEEFCATPGLAPAVRETLLVIDQSAVKPGKPETFRTDNAELFKLITGLAAADQAISSGVMAARERLTITVANAHTGGLTQVFTGCLPGMSQDELAARAAKGEDGSIDTFFGSDMKSKLEEARTTFMTKVMLMVVQIAGEEGSGAGDSFGNSGFVKILGGIGAGSGRQDSVRRVFLYTDPSRALAAIPANVAEARTAAFAQASDAHSNLGMSEFYLIPAGRPAEGVQRDFLDAYLLGSGADLKFAGTFSPDSVAKIPVSIVNYTGELPLTPEIKSPLEMRLAAAADGTLVNSWISYTSSRGVRRTPVSGQFVCNPDGCELRGDPDRGLGQRWRTEPGAAPQPLVDGPFGGMRLISGKDNGQTLTARIFDPVIFVGEKGDIAFTARRSISK
ncbi:hypothetical protein A0U87_20620 [Sphingobium sp. MP9-4]|uniref:hypothetical protein n=1 Tax=Sphingobium sp. MP9-4 TaxID=1761936 RepID=UPI0010CA9161|nr:hypothetical protein [Sphingobium sp. MP9-4]TKV41564.1 hypothetical protein A0U87_20620 [Sphingobium sp. MP9-4]